MTKDNNKYDFRHGGYKKIKKVKYTKSICICFDKRKGIY